MLVSWSVDLQAAVLLTLQLSAFINISKVHFSLYVLGFWVTSCNPTAHFNLDSNRKRFIWPFVFFNQYAICKCTCEHHGLFLRLFSSTCHHGKCYILICSTIQFSLKAFFLLFPIVGWATFGFPKVMPYLFVSLKCLYYFKTAIINIQIYFILYTFNTFYIMWFLIKAKMQLSKSIRIVSLLNFLVQWILNNITNIIMMYYSSNYELRGLVPLILAGLTHPCQCLHRAYIDCSSDSGITQMAESWTQSWRWLKLRNQWWVGLDRTKQRGRSCDLQNTEHAK